MRERADEVPHLRDLRLQRVPPVGVVHDDVRFCQTLLARCLHCDTGACVSLGHPSLLDQAVDRDVGRHVDHDDRGEPSPAGLDEQGDVEHDHVIGVLLRGEPPSGLDADRWMHDRVQLFERRGVVEHDRREHRPVQPAVAVENPGAEPLDDRVQHRLAGLLELPGDRVGVDDDGPPGGQERGDGRLPGADAAREAHEDHAPDRTGRSGESSGAGGRVVGSQRVRNVGLNHESERADHLP